MPIIYTKKTAATTLGVSVRTLTRAMDAGLLPYRQIGKRIIYTDSDLESYLSSCAVSKGPKKPA